MPTLETVNTPAIADRIGVYALRWAGMLLVATVWISAGIFGLYILAFYAAALLGGDLEKWNKILPGIYSPGAGTATASIGLHFAMGGIILMLGSLQLIEGIRLRYPAIHRWVGRVYVVASLLTAVGGLVFIALKGTIGGAVMNVGFAVYGLLMALASIQTYRHAVAGRMQAHRAWALRLYALAIGSWLYRMEYGIWIVFTHKLGHTDDFTGWFDRLMSFFFYVPNLLVAEVFIRARSRQVSPVLKLASAAAILAVSVFLWMGTYKFTVLYWGPAILEWIM